MTTRFRRTLPTLAGYVDERIVRWRTGTSEGQVAVLGALVILSTGIMLLSLISYNTFPAATFVIPMLLGTMALRYKPLLALVLFIVAATAITVTHETIKSGMTTGRVSTLIVDGARRDPRAVRVEPSPQRPAGPSR